MKRHSFIRKAVVSFILAGLMATPVLALDAFETYTVAYRNLMTNACWDAGLEATFTLNGEEKTASGNFKVDASGDKPILYLQAEIDGESFLQFSDGDFVYSEARGVKTKFPLGVKEEQEQAPRNDPEAPDGAPQASPTFDSSEFLKEVSSFLEVGKLKELGLFDPLPKEFVVDTSVNGNTYSMKVMDIIVGRMADVITSSITTEGSEIKISDLQDFRYEAVIEGDYVTSLTVGGTMDVSVPASLSGTDSDETYALDVTLTATFNNPGSEITIELPSTEGY